MLGNTWIEYIYAGDIRFMSLEELVCRDSLTRTGGTPAGIGYVDVISILLKELACRGSQS